MTLFLKALLGGILGVIGAWIVVLAYSVLRLPRIPSGELRAIAGGWDLLVRTPLVVVILATAFGIGFWVTGRIALVR